MFIYESTQKHHGVQADPVVEKVRVEEDDWWHNVSPKKGSIKLLLIINHINQCYRK